MHILVTGGCGFIGGWVVNKFIKEGYCVHFIDKNVKSGMHTINDNVDCNYFELDKYIWSINHVLRSKKIDYIIHLGAYSTVRDALHDPESIVTNNILATANILNAIENSEYKPKKIVFASSSAAIEPITSYYGMSKRTCEDMLRIFSEVTGIPTISLRFGNVYGAAQNPKNGTLIAKLVEWAYHIKNNLPCEPVKIFGDGTQRRDYVYVMDVVSAIKTCIENDMPTCIENVSTGESVTTNFIISQCLAVAKHFGIPMQELDHTKGNSFDKDDVTLPKSIKLLSLQNYKQPYILAEGLYNAFNWRLNTEPDVFEHRFDSEGRIL